MSLLRYSQISRAAGRENIWAGGRFFRKYLVASFTLAPIWLAPLPVCAQELRLSSGSAAPGKTVMVRVELSSPAGREPSALEWEIMAPPGQLAPDVTKASPGKRAESAGKKLHCAVQKDGGALCLIAGGQGKMANGPVATLTFTIPKDANLGDVQVRLVRGAAVFSDSRRIPLPPAESWVQIRSK